MRKYQDKGYFSYLLRLSPVDDGDNVVWRISLERILTRERKGFGDVDEMVEYLRQEMGQLPLHNQDIHEPSVDMISDK